MTTLDSIPTSFAEAAKLLGDQTSVSVGNNTHLVRADQLAEEGRIELVLHSTPVVVFYSDNSAQLFSGGWRTVTTKDRLNRVLRPNGWSVYSERRTWKIERRFSTHGGRFQYPFVEGFVVPLKGYELVTLPEGKPSHCECGAAWDARSGGYSCATR